jgi:hypothetical protein
VYSEDLKLGNKIETALDLRDQLSESEVASQKEEMEKVSIE